MEQYMFTVPTKGLCIMCLTDDASTKITELSIQSISSYLKLDFRKIFNIKVPKLFHKDGSEIQNDSVNIKVALCKSCSNLRNKFCDLYDQLDEIHQRLNSCVETMQGVMINSESNAIRSRRYRQHITEGRGNLTASQVAELIKTSIPDKFRKETIQKCIFQVEKAKQETTPKENSNQKEPADFVRELEFESSFNTGVYDKQEDAYQDESDDEAMKVDEDADPEELMMRYNSLPDNSKYEAHGDSEPGWMGEWQDGNLLELGNWESGTREAGTSSTADNNKVTTFNSKYKCNICGKVVVSLKNFELHQRRHTGDKPFACPFCDQHFRDTSNLRSHTLRYHRQFLFAKFKTPNMRQEQFKTALDKIVQSIVQVSEGVGITHQSHQCVLCNKEYTQKYAIEDHIVQRHYDVLSTAIINIQEDVMNYSSQEIAKYLAEIQESENTCTICGLCGVKFQNGYEVNNHMKVHVRVKVARSQGAAQKTNASDSLIQLKMKCNFCCKYFDDLNALTKHKSMHRGSCGNGVAKDSIYNCEHCGRSFGSYYSQRSHILSFHRHQVFAKYLPPSTTSAEIESVVQGITGKYTKLPNGLFQCSLCSKEITQLRKLQTHMLVTHFDEVVDKLKASIGRIHNGPTDSPPQLEQYEDSIVGTIALGEHDDDDGNEDVMEGSIACIVSLKEGEDADGNPNVEISYPE